MGRINLAKVAEVKRQITLWMDTILKIPRHLLHDFHGSLGNPECFAQLSNFQCYLIVAWLLWKRRLNMLILKSLLRNPTPPHAMRRYVFFTLAFQRCCHKEDKHSTKLAKQK